MTREARLAGRREKEKKKLAEDDGRIGQRDELLDNIRRLIRIVLDRLEQGSRDASLDQGQIRMLGSLAVRSLRLWHEALGRPAREDEILSAAQRDLADKLRGSQGRGVEA